MNKHDGRKTIIHNIATKQCKLDQIDFRETHIKDLFGSDVFSESVERERLSKGVFKGAPDDQEGRYTRARYCRRVASAMKDWAIEKGATHYTHLFQPMTGLTAEKHDSFLSPDGDGGRSPNSPARN